MNKTDKIITKRKAVLKALSIIQKIAVEDFKHDRIKMTVRLVERVLKDVEALDGLIRGEYHATQI